MTSDLRVLGGAFVPSVAARAELGTFAGVPVTTVGTYTGVPAVGRRRGRFVDVEVRSATGSVRTMTGALRTATGSIRTATGSIRTA
jgi:hypothetical protein